MMKRKRTQKKTKKGYSNKTGEGVNIDRLFVRGKIDVDTYLRYLGEYERQMRHGKGKIAEGVLADGELYYRMTTKEDTFYPDNYPHLAVPPSPKEMQEFLRGRQPKPVRMTGCFRQVHDVSGQVDCQGETWDATGTMSDQGVPDAGEFWVDGLLKVLEDGR